MKLWKKILLDGNDIFSHIIISTFFTLKFGWYGLIFSFISHYFIDLIPHSPSSTAIGSYEKKGKEKIIGILSETLKGILVALIILFTLLVKFGFTKVVLVGAGIFISILPDVISFLAHSKKILWLMQIDRYSHSFHEKFHQKNSWWNLLQPTVVVIFIRICQLL